MDISQVAAAAGGAGPGTGAAPAERPTPYDIAAFDAARERAAGTVESTAPAAAQAATPVGAGGFDYALRLLSSLNASPQGLTAASSANGAAAALSPSEMLALTVKSHQFLFQSQLTANVANRTSDGVQQLFRQQS